MPAARCPAWFGTDISGYKQTGSVRIDETHLQRQFCLEQMCGEPQRTPTVGATTGPNVTAVTR